MNENVSENILNKRDIRIEKRRTIKSPEKKYPMESILLFEDSDIAMYLGRPTPIPSIINGMINDINLLHKAYSANPSSLRK